MLIVKTMTMLFILNSTWNLRMFSSAFPKDHLPLESHVSEQSYEHRTVFQTAELTTSWLNMSKYFLQPFFFFFFFSKNKTKSLFMIGLPPDSVTSFCEHLWSNSYSSRSLRLKHRKYCKENVN